MDNVKEMKGLPFVRSILLCAVGFLFIVFGFSYLPIIGTIVGAGLIYFGIYPWINVIHRSNVKVLIGSSNPDYPKDVKIQVAILSATKKCDGFDFDPRRIDPSSVRIGRGKDSPDGDMSDPEIYARSLKDFNNDGIADLVVYFSSDPDRIHERVERTCIHAKTWDGERIFGCSAIERNGGGENGSGCWYENERFNHGTEMCDPDGHCRICDYGEWETRGQIGEGMP